jgi:hypothetical protein
MRKAVFVVIFVLRCSLSAQPDPFIQTIEKVKLSVVPVACSSWPDSKDGVSIKEIEGTGFFVSYEGNFITAAHVINDHFKWNKHGVPALECFPVIYAPNPTWQSFKWFQFGSCILDDAIDIAVCKTILNPFGVSGLHIGRLHLIPSVPKDGTPVAFTGFPQLIVVPVTSRANVASTGAFFRPEQIDIMIDKTSWHGVSGGPLYLGDGSVVGIVLRTGEGLWSGMAWARHTSSVLKFLSDNKILFWQEEPEHPTGKKKP